MEQPRRITGCQHNEEECCQDCLQLLAEGKAQVIPSDPEHRPQPGESLEHYAQRMAAIGIEVDAKKVGDEQPEQISREEARRRIHDETIPEPVRRYYRQLLYGVGGGGRKEVQQNRLAKQAEALKENFGQRTMEAMQASVGVRQFTGLINRQTEPSGRQRRKMRKLQKRMMKVARNAG